MAHHQARHTARRSSRANGNASEDPCEPTPPASPAVTRSRGARVSQAKGTIGDVIETQTLPVRVVEVPAHYTLPPTVPSPFIGTLDASLDAILVWASQYDNTNAVMEVLLKDVDTATNWPETLQKMWVEGDKPVGRGRYLVEDLLFLVTRKLLPEQIAENRAAMGRLYSRRKQVAIRMVPRYDMLREWKFDASHHAMTFPSMAPENLAAPPPLPASLMFPTRRPLMPNIISTLIAAPPNGFATLGMRERMKHHITGLDDYLLLSDTRVQTWSDTALVAMTSQIVLQWQYLRQNNETLQDLEVDDWAGMGRKAEDCEWVVDDVKKPAWYLKKDKVRSASMERKEGETNVEMQDESAEKEKEKWK